MSYQDYVIKDGRFIGKFEEMYAAYDEPWNQKQAADFYILQSTAVSIRKYKCGTLLEAGSGLGGGTAHLTRLLPDVLIDGMDISKTAVRKAKEAYPKICFFIGNLSEYCHTGNLKYDALLFSQIMWYILDDLNQIIKDLTERYYGKLIMVNQTFYNPGIQKYGKEYFTSLDEMCGYLPWKCLEQIIETRPQEESIQTHSVFRVEEK